MKDRGRAFRCFFLIMILAVLLVGFSGCGRYKRVTRQTDAVTLGIDVARYQGTIDWQEVSQGWGGRSSQQLSGIGQFSFL